MARDLTEPDLELTPANTDDRVGATPMLLRLAELGFQGDLLGDSGYKGMPFARAALDHGHSCLGLTWRDPRRPVPSRRNQVGRRRGTWSCSSCQPHTRPASLRQ